MQSNGNIKTFFNDNISYSVLSRNDFKSFCIIPIDVRFRLWYNMYYRHVEIHFNRKKVYLCIKEYFL